MPIAVNVGWINGMRFVASDDKGIPLLWMLKKKLEVKARNLVPCNCCW